MSGILFWLLIVACVVALVVLFFPFKFKIEFEAGEHGARAHFFFFKKNFWNVEKKWGKEESVDGNAEKSGTEKSDGVKSKDSEDDELDDDCMPTFVATAPTPKVEAKSAPEPVKPTEKPSSLGKNAEEKPVSQPAAEPVKPVAKSAAELAEKPSAEPAAEPETKPAAISVTNTAADSVEKKSIVSETKPAEEKPADVKPAKKEKPERHKLTEVEFWTILLTPDLDARALRYVKRALAALLKLFHLKFHECFVEGIRTDYKTMGYGAAANGIIKSFPVLCDWDLRMDWCGDKQLRAAGTLLGTVNLCRLLGLILVLLYYAGILLFLFWRRRAHVLKTGKLPELGFVRKKIIGWIVEE
ncbi:MAG: hypothetical protein MJY99_08250 [Fibrobacter sp.]|nr:hypothetical protein [Fibrobacter sp.]